MKRLAIGFSWAPRSGVSPAILAAMNIRGEYPRSLQCIQRDCWVVDYEYASFGRLRVQSPEMTWVDRPAQTVHLYPPNAVFWEDSRREGGERHSSWIEFDGGNEAGLGRFVRSNEHGFVRFLDPFGLTGDMFLNAAQAGHDRGEDGFWSAQASLCSVMALVTSAEHTDGNTYLIDKPSASREGTEFARRVAAFLLERLSEEVTLGSLARDLDVSVSSLAHRYSHEAHETPMAALARLRIERAKILLVKGEPLKAIADQFGFCDAFHLSKVFKRVTGVAPREFVKMHRSHRGAQVRGSSGSGLD